MNWQRVEELIDRALAEDIGTGDLSTQLLVSEKSIARAEILAKSTGVLAGQRVVTRVFQKLDASVKLHWLILDGDRFFNSGAKGLRTKVAEISGNARALLIGERTALNFLAHLSGIATLTRKFVDAVWDTPALILDTRKTTPGLRELEKWAVKIGGGFNHRAGLFDQILIKENHIAAAGGLKEVLSKMKSQWDDQGLAKCPLDRQMAGESESFLLDSPVLTDSLPAKIPVIEVQVPGELELVLNSGARWLLLDNFSSEDLQKALEIVRAFEKLAGQRIFIEVSGGITLENVRLIAEMGVDFISVGALTHSAPACDFSLELRL